MNARPWYKRYGADFVHGTLGLTLEEKGAYSLCLDLIYDRGGPIPDDARWLSGICNVSVRKWNALRDRLIDAGKLSTEDGFLTNSRAEREIENAAKTARKLAESGAKGGRNRVHNRVDDNNNNGLDEAGLKHTRINQKLDTRVKEEPNGSLSEASSDASPPGRRKREKYPPDFEEFWRGYPTDALMSKAKAFQAWKRLDEATKADVIASLPAFRVYCASKPDYRPVHAVRFITEERFLGFLETAAKAASKVFVAKGTPEWDAWQRVRKTMSARSDVHRAEGWWFPSRWPEQAATQH